MDGSGPEASLSAASLLLPLNFQRTQRSRMASPLALPSPSMAATNPAKAIEQYTLVFG